MTTCIVIPTIPGREVLLSRTIDGYRADAPDVRFLIVRDRPTIGEAWTDGAVRALELGASTIHLAADDIVPHHGAVLAGTLAAEAGTLPSPRILHVGGSLLQCGSLGHGLLLPECATGTPAGSSQFPVLPADVMESILPLPPIHYYADDYVAAAARDRGMDVRVVRDYLFTHLEGSAGRARLIARSAADRETYMQAVVRLGGDAGLVQYDRGDDDDEAEG